MKRKSPLILSAVSMAMSLAASSHASVTGDPFADGWVYGGHSLDNGVYVTGSANYGFDTYSAGFTVQSGSNLEISDGSLSWLAGDTVVGVGGAFRSITAAEAGWGSISGNAVNALLPTSSPYSGPKLQVKFGTANATWITSTTAPNSGNGNSSSSNGGGRVQVRTSGFFQTGTPLAGQDEPWTWDGNSGQLLVLDKDDHIAWSSSVDKEVARMIWVWDDDAKQVASWQLLLNVSLMDRLNPSFAGLLPDIGDLAILTVQQGDGSFTDAMVSVAAIPEPASLGLLAAGGLMLARRRRAGA